MGIQRRGRHAKVQPARRILAALGSLALAAAGLVAIDTPAQALTQTYSYTGGPQIYVVPDAVTSLTVSLEGAQGGSPSAGGTGGKGATVTATIAVNPGEVLMLMVGGNGGSNGGWNGGGRGAGTGGGATDIRRPAFSTSSSCAYTLTCTAGDRIVVAGGGGGGGWAQNVPGTANGGDAGQSASAGAASNLSGGDATAGGGASPSAGGAAGNGTFTSSGQGASAGSLANGAPSAWVASATGGGGGGGYYGGGSGGVSQDSAPQADGVGGGGGGSSWAGGTGVTGGAFTSGTTTGDGSITIDPPSAIPTAAFAFTGAPQFYTVPANTSALYVRLYGAGGGLGGAGDIVVTPERGSTDVTLKAVPVGTWVWLRTSKVKATGTTATNLVGFK